LRYARAGGVGTDRTGPPPPARVASLTLSIAAVVLAPALATERVVAGPVAWALLVYLGVVPTALAYVLYVLGLRTTPVAASGVLALVEPLTATVLGVLAFGDRLGALGALGAALLAGAVGLLRPQPSRPGWARPLPRPSGGRAGVRAPCPDGRTATAPARGGCRRRPRRMPRGAPPRPTRS